MNTNDDMINESLKLVHTEIGNGTNKVAKVYKDTEWDEHRVKHFFNGKHQKDADYHDDKEGCVNHAKSWAHKADMKENTELDDITTLIDQIVAEDSQSVNTLNSILMSKTQSILESMKAKIASEMFSDSIKIESDNKGDE